MNSNTALRHESFTSFNTAVRSDSTHGAPEKQHLINLLFAGGELKLAASVSRCCSEYRALGCAAGHTFNRFPTHRCNYRLCVDCARERQRRACGRLFPILRGFQRAYRHDRQVLITLTVRSSHEALVVHDRRFKAWFKRLRRSKRWKHCIRGAVAGFEFTWNETEGWHYHVHILAFRRAWYAQEELAEQWQRITDGAGVVVDIREAHDFRGAVAEVVKYCFKPAEVEKWNVQQVAEFNALRRVKLSDCYGELRGLKVESDDDLQPDSEHEHLEVGSPCPDCGEPLVSVTLPRSVVHEAADTS